ncbi:GGDEF and EAL domain-containing protein [Acidipila sp. EB88]|uniref:sensor domain-containing protein n=1 Tax=Acidipila sp. EB88 TaxID=2305226 RepID=UPI000F601B2B|nr:GGDEF and EAL domain-containing protein [Acidipila sp. EB88]RRA47416.1 EAL domain-containing protein [Acidipila sp. EB88]
MADQNSPWNNVTQKLLQGIDYVPDGIILVDTRGAILFLNPAASRMTGWEQSEAIGKDARSVFNVVNAVTREAAWDVLGQVLLDRQSYTLLPNSVLISKNGTEVPIEDAISPFNDDQGEFAGAVIIFKDMSLTRWQLAKALHRANHDPLTSLPNRTTLHERMLSGMARLGSASHALCLMAIDVDHFKSVNDKLGHAIGDFVLQVLATRIAGCLRASDLVCRVGGDEFVVLLPLSGGVDDLEILVQSLLEAGRAPIEVLGVGISVSLSIGIALRHEQSGDVAGFLGDADKAAYRAKAAGGDRAQLFELDFRKDAGAERTLQYQIVEALRTDQFLLQYQPVVDCRTGRMVGAEALVRWRHPDGGLLLPISFVEAAERSGLIVPLGQMVLQQALAQRKEWLERGLPLFTLFANVSAVELVSGEYVERLRELLAANDYVPYSLTLELTESSLLGVHHQRLLIPAIRALKVQVAMDDFGVGYSNIEYLRNCAVDCVKIDGSFVAGIPQRSQDMALVKAMIAMAASVRANSIAEGVETAEQAWLLAEAGCMQVQGNYYSPPVFPEEIEQLLLHQWTVPVPELAQPTCAR